jgi:hypothetical protein
MRATLVTPITIKARQQTMMKYGLRMENLGIALFVRLPEQPSLSAKDSDR